MLKPIELCDASIGAGCNKAKLTMLQLVVLGIINNLIPVTLGNIVGGAVLVGFTYYVAYKYSPSKSKDNSCDVKAY